MVINKIAIVGDMPQVLASPPSGYMRRICLCDFLERIEDVCTIVSGSDRAYEGSAITNLTLPHFSDSNYFSDPTHRRQFWLYSIRYFCANHVLFRQIQRCFSKKPLQSMVQWMQKFYEDFLCLMLPRYNMTYVLVHAKGNNGALPW